MNKLSERIKKRIDLLNHENRTGISEQMATGSLLPEIEKLEKEREQLINVIIKLYPDVSEEWEDDNCIHLNDIIKQITGKSWEEIIKGEVNVR